MEHVKNDESGISLIEVVVSMFMIALLAVAFLPFLIRSYQVSGSNSTLSTATQVLNQQFDRLRAGGTTCADLTTFRGGAAAVTDPGRNAKFTVRVTYTCPGSTGTNPIPVKIEILDAATKTVVQATTMFYVTG